MNASSGLRVVSLTTVTSLQYQLLYGNIFPSTVNIWNTLPAATLDQPNIAKFKDELDRFY